MKWMYGSTNGAQFIKIMAPFFIFHYYQGPLQAILQALDLARAAMINSLIGNAVKITVIFMLASQAQFGINGAALGIAAGTVLVTMLHYATVLKRIQFTIYVLDYVKFAFAAVAAGWVRDNHLWTTPSNLAPLLKLFTAITITALVYVILILVLKLLTKSDLMKIPYLNKAELNKQSTLQNCVEGSHYFFSSL